MNKKPSFISSKYPSFRESLFVDPYKWLKSRRREDGAENLWRIHDNLYDLTTFINKHPGGSDWLKWTKGTDITEAFEAHHIRPLANNLLINYKVREAKQKREFKLTFNENDFYKTLKRRVNGKLKDIDWKPEFKSKIIHDTLLVLTFCFAIVSVNLNSYLIAILSSLCLTWTVIASHNFCHRKNNWRMYTFNLSLMSYREWRITHALSHHLYPNSLYDLEMSFYEPFFNWLPSNNKNAFQRFGSWVYGPIIYAAIFISEFIKRILTPVFTSKNHIYLEDSIPIILPLTMLLFSNKNIHNIIYLWLYIILVSSYIFGLISINSAHHHPNILHDGDALRKTMDWGIYQIDTVINRNDVKKSLFLILTHFGDHTLHHLFPTIDHSILPQINNILIETCNEFKIELIEYSWLQHIIGQHQQLANIHPNTIPRDSH